jgi:hypothetical protein
MTNTVLRKVEYFEISEEEYRNLSPFEKTKAAAKRERKKGKFHGWATDTILTEDAEERTPQAVYSTNAIIERPDGSIVKIKPEYIRFID